MTTINPYINFNGNCREAMGFYQQCLGGELSLQIVAGSPMEAYCPQEMKDNILHSTLIKGPMLIMGSDMVGPGGFTKGSSLAISVNCSSEDEIYTFYGKFAESGEIIDPLKMQFWGGMFGVVNDQFGIRWMFNYNKEPMQ
jgi:PhnB protein